MKNQLLLLLVAILACFACKNEPKPQMQAQKFEKGSFGYDRDFLKKHQNALLLVAPDDSAAQIAVVAGYQARVMTSTANGPAGNSYGWLNYPLISGEKGYQSHINVVGGEERFWIAPEGGQFSVFFPKGAKFDFADWQTPGLIDTAVFQLKKMTASQAVFVKNAVLENYSGAKFDLQIARTVSVLSKIEIGNALKINDLKGLHCVGYETDNALTNAGADWSKSSGTLGIWILGMFNPGDRVTVVAPFSKSNAAKLLLTDDYFGKVPAERLVVGDSAVFFKGDGKLRSKIGIAPASLRPVAGSFDAEKGILTLIQYDLVPGGDYLKSAWKQHADPFGGDAFNAYNDGPVADGTQLGPFYELESTSPAPALKSGETLRHRHRTFHFEGDRAGLDRVAKAVLGIGLEEIEGSLQAGK